MRTRQEMRRPEAHAFDVVAGVPCGGLHLAAAYSRCRQIPVIYARPRTRAGRPKVLKGLYDPGEAPLMVDDLVVSGSSIINAATVLRSRDLAVRDAIVLVDRGRGASERLRHEGIKLIGLLSLPVALNYYLSQGWRTRCSTNGISTTWTAVR